MSPAVRTSLCGSPSPSSPSGCSTCGPRRLSVAVGDAIQGADETMPLESARYVAGRGRAPVQRDHIVGRAGTGRRGHRARHSSAARHRSGRASPKRKCCHSSIPRLRPRRGANRLPTARRWPEHGPMSTASYGCWPTITTPRGQTSTKRSHRRTPIRGSRRGSSSPERCSISSPKGSRRGPGCRTRTRTRRP